MKIYRIAQHGEWWIIDDKAVYADSNTGDMGHEAYVIESVRNEIASDMGYFNLPEYYDWDEVKQEIVKELVRRGDVDETEFSQKYGDDFIENMPYNTDIFDEIAQENGVEKIKLDVADNAMDARDYGMKELGWKRVEGKHIQTYTLTSEDLKSIDYGLWDAFGEGLDNDNAMDDTEFIIEVRSNNKTFWNVPYHIISKHNPVAVAKHGGVGAYEYANTSRFKIYKIAQQDLPYYCAWCKKHMRGPKLGYDHPLTSHGICNECEISETEKVLEETGGQND